ncbi:MAG: DUF547 domain-containing protein [Planctomycetota bacterium]
MRHVLAPRRFIAILVLSLIAIRPALPGEKVYVGSKGTPAKRVAMDQIDHSNWDALLRRYVDPDGKVDYKRWKANAADRRTLHQYLAQLSTADPTLKSAKAAKLAFWINAYNSVTIAGILQQYPTSSIRNHTARLFGYNIWHDLLLTVGGRPYSLDEIEHQVLRKMGEPRIHFAIVCAAKGCPRLLAEAYTTEQLDNQLEVNAKDFFARRTHFRFDAARGSFQLSSILKWFGSDFGANDKAMLKRIAAFLPTQQSRKAAAKGQGSVSYLDYDWDLNDQR